MPYKKIQLFDASFLKGTATAEELTAHINNRVVYLQNACGGSNRCEISSVETSFVNASNATSIETTRTVTSTNSGNNTASTLGASSMPYISSSSGTETGTEVETATLAAGISEETLTKWLLLTSKLLISWLTIKNYYKTSTQYVLTNLQHIKTELQNAQKHSPKLFIISIIGLLCLVLLIVILF